MSKGGFHQAHRWVLAGRKMAERAAQAAAFLATIPAHSRAAGGGGAIVLAPARLRLLDRLAEPLKPPLSEAIRTVIMAKQLARCGSSQAPMSCFR